MKGDGQVVDVFFTDYTVEVVPGFRESDNSFTYPNTHDGGTWNTTNPLAEISICEDMDCSFHVFRDFCKLIRAWKAENGVKCGGLLIDTLVYNFFQDHKEYDKIKRNEFDFEGVIPELLDLFQSQDDQQKYWIALGSNQYIWNKKEFNFISKAKQAFQMIDDCKDDEDAKWAVFQSLFGEVFPGCPDEKSVGESKEEFLNQRFSVNLTGSLKIDCEVTQNGFRPFALSSLLTESGRQHFLKFKKSLRFFIKSTNVEKPYKIYWKVRNVGNVAISKKMIRGQIIEGEYDQKEHTSFNGPHYVECFLVKDGVCVAKDRIYVPIHDSCL